MKVLMKGNEALAEAAIRAGCRHFFGYPITPQTELAAYMSKRMPKVGGTYLQAESEIAAINMVLGASAAGVRAMTSSSSPGISLKGEGISYMAGSDLPAVIINVQRGGPGLGGIQPSPGGLLAGHQGHRPRRLPDPGVRPLHRPGDGGLDFRRLRYGRQVPHARHGAGRRHAGPDDGAGGAARGGLKRELPEKEWAANGHGGKRAAQHHQLPVPDPRKAGGAGQGALCSATSMVKANEQMAEEYLTEDADIVLVAYGASSRVARSAVNKAREKGIKAGLVRPITLWPFPDTGHCNRAARHAKDFLAVEMSMGQMVDDVKLAVDVQGAGALLRPHRRHDSHPCRGAGTD